MVDGPLHLRQIALHAAFNALAQIAVCQVLDDAIDLANGCLLRLQQRVECAGRFANLVVLRDLDAAAVVKVLRDALRGFLHQAQGLDHRADDAIGQDHASQCADCEQHDADQLRLLILGL